MDLSSFDVMEDFNLRLEYAAIQSQDIAFTWRTENDSKLARNFNIIHIVASSVFLLWCIIRSFWGQCKTPQPPRWTIWALLFMLAELVVIANQVLDLGASIHQTNGSLATIFSSTSEIACLATLIGAVLAFATFILNYSSTVDARIFYNLYMLAAFGGLGLTVSSGPRDYINLATMFVAVFDDIWIESQRSHRGAEPIKNTSIVGCCTFSWLSRLFEEFGDTPSTLPDLPAAFTPEVAYKPLQSGSGDGVAPLPPFWSMVMANYGSDVVESFFYELADIICRFGQPWLLQVFLRNRQPYLIVSLFSLNLITTFASAGASFKVNAMGAKLKGALISWVMDCVLDNPTAVQSGKVSVINLVEVDTQRIQDFIIYVHAVWSAPVQVLTCLISIGMILGWKSAVAGILIVLLLLPFLSICSNILKKRIGQLLERKDERISMTSQFLRKSHTIKLLNLYIFVEQKLTALREQEMKAVQGLILVSAALNTVVRCTPTVFSVVVFTTAQLSRVELDSSTLFPSLMFLSLLANPLGLLPMVASSWSGCVVSYERLQSFLSPSHQEPNEKYKDNDRTPKEARVAMCDVSYSWDPSNGANTVFSDVNFTAQGNELVVMDGNTGSGKSIILSMLTRMRKSSSGVVYVSGQVAYCSQIPWIMSGTVRENILFGKAYNAAWYETVLRACALDSDIAKMDLKDMTLVGNIGSSLSGGQRSRISLARAVYANADIYILDNPLSAVDSRVQSHIIGHVLGDQGLLNQKLRIVVSNTPALMEIADRRLLLQGRTLHEVSHKQEPVTTMQPVDDDSKNNNEPSSPSIIPIPAAGETLTIEEVLPLTTNSLLQVSSGRFTTPLLYKQSIRTQHRRWIRMGGYYEWSLVTLLIGMVYVSGICSTYFLKFIAMDSSQHKHTTKWLALFALCSLVQTSFMLIWLVVAWYLCQKKVSINIHANLVRGVFQSPMEFLQSKEVGDILNRFTNDLTRNDFSLFNMCYNLINVIIRLGSSVVVLIISLPLSILYLIPFGVMFYRLQNMFIDVYVPLKRLETSTRSPMITNLQDVINGVWTIRIFHGEEIFRERMFDRCYNNLQVYFTLFGIQPWLVVRLNTMSAVMQLGSMVLFLYLDVDPSTFGLSMSYLILTAASVTQLVLNRSELESESVCTQRIFEYCDLAPEAQHGSLAVPADWPSQGKIHFQHYSASHQTDTPLVLKDINLEIQPNAKVAIVGRTGAGKSTFASSLFRIFEAAGGTIEIDGVDISKVDMDTLRSRLSIIPQDSTVFPGSVRENLDPGNLYDQGALRKAITDCQFGAGFKSTEDALDFIIDDDGRNLSAGNLQLLGFARAMLKKSRVLILDEATAAIDRTTEDAIRHVMHDRTHNMTTITIAHRLRTIMDSDRIIVLDNGRVVEVGSPTELLQTGTVFSEMVRKARLEIDVPSV